MLEEKMVTCPECGSQRSYKDGIRYTRTGEIQRITEASLKEVFGCEFVKSELTLGNLRIDTLAFDNENKSFIIIEYKIDQSFSVIDQGYAYLGLLLNNKAEFILEYNERKGQSLKRDDVDWSQSKVIFVSPQFTKYQKQAINFRDLPIELWEVSKFENGTLLFNQLKSPETSESITKISPRSDIVQKLPQVLSQETVHMLSEVRERKPLEQAETCQGLSDSLYHTHITDSHKQRSCVK